MVNKRLSKLMSGVKIESDHRGIILRKDLFNPHTNKFMHSKAAGLFVPTKRRR